MLKVNLFQWGHNHVFCTFFFSVEVYMNSITTQPDIYFSFKPIIRMSTKGFIYVSTVLLLDITWSAT